MRSLLIQANAKINLSLKIIGKRPDGYHNLKSVFQSIDLSDFLFFEKTKEEGITGAIVCPEAKNIIFKAKEALEKKVNKKLPCKINLQKSIPVSAGLGGGSADAAAVFEALNLLYGLRLSRKELAKIGKEVGADVPFFFWGGTCRVEGIGEKVSPIKRNLPEFFVLFRPHKRVETKMVYDILDKTGKSFLEINREICPGAESLEKYLSGFQSEFYGLSGSGPTMFCGFNNYERAKKAAEGYSDFNGDVFICKPKVRALEIL